MFAVLLCVAALRAEGVSLYPRSALQEIPFNQVRISDSFWSERIRVVQEVTLPDLLDLAEEQGKIDNFRIVAGRKAGKYRAYNAADSDVYKLIEAAAYSFASRSNAALEARLDAVIDDIVAAQQPDGYLNTQFTLPLNHPAAPKAESKFVGTFGFGPEFRWASRADNWPKAYSQLYCAGHLMEAAVAYHRATGKRVLLDAAIRNADHIALVFTSEKIRSYADHPEVEIGLMKIYEATGNQRYAELAGQFARHLEFSRPPDLNRAANRKPLVGQSEAFGHCVRTAYIYTGATDAVRAGGAEDLQTALDSLWRNVTGAKMYVHGGTGNGSPAEQHGYNFDLPIESTYSETCAAVAQGQWNHSLNLLTGNARYAALTEHLLWNNALAGLSLDGTNFFYANKLNIGTTDRKNEHSGIRRRYLFCCPSKVPGFVTGIGRWIYAQNADALLVNQFIGSDVSTTLAGQSLKLTQSSDLPQSGYTRLVLGEAPTNEFSIRLRLPAWVSGDGPVPGGLYHFGPGEMPRWSLSLNGKEIKLAVDLDGCLTVRRRWSVGDTLEFSTTLPVRRVYTDEKVTANHGRVALMRGPLMYCLEGVDNDFDVLDLALPPRAKISASRQPGLLGSVTVLRGEGVLSNGRKVKFTAVPYYAWQNRGIAALATLLIEDRARLTPEKPPAGKPMNTDG